MEGIEPLTPVKEVPTKNRPWRWCMVCNIVLNNKTTYQSFRYGLQKSEDLVRRLGRVLDIDVTAVTPNSYCVCHACVRKVKKYEEGIVMRDNLKADFQQTVVCNRMTSPGSSPASTPPASRIKRMAKDQGTPPAAESNRKGAETAAASRPRKRALVYDAGNLPKDADDTMKLTLDDLCLKINEECKDLCSTEKPSIFRKSSPSDLDKWSYDKQEKELEERAPFFLACLKAAATSKENLKRTKQKTEETIKRGIMTSASTLLNCRSKGMNLHGVMTALILKRAGAKKLAFRKLHARFICASYSVAHSRQVAYGKDFDKTVRKWQKLITDQALVAEAILAGLIPDKTIEVFNTKRHKGYRLVGDNLDMKNQARYMTMDHQNKDWHLFNMMAVENRVSSYHLPNDKPIVEDVSSVSQSIFLPSVADEAGLRESWILHIANIIARYLPKLKWFKEHMPAYSPHKYMQEAKKKTNVVSLGVSMENENTSEGIANIMQQLHSYVPGHDTDKPCVTMCGGDLLTVERESNAQEDKQDSTTPSRKLLGLMPVLEDWHTLANFYVTIWKLLYDTESASDTGTLYAARNFLKARNVPVNPMSDFNASKYFLQKYTEALVVCSAMTFFGMEEMSSEPTKNTFPEQTQEAIKSKLGQLLDEFAIPSEKEISSQGNFMSCPVHGCKKTYKTLRGLKSHISKKHGPDAPQPLIPRQSRDGDDRIFNYSRTALSLCLLAWDFNDACKMADGDRVVRLYKYLMLFFKATDKIKYSYQSFRLLAQVSCLLSEQEAHNLTHNRFVNHEGGLHGNIPCDQAMEHDNRTVKEQCVGFRGKVTEAAVKRVSESAQKIEELMKLYDKESQVKKSSGKHTVQSHEEDVQALVKKMQAENHGIFENIPGRFHHAFPDFPSSPLARLNHEDLSKWMKNTLHDLSTKSVFSGK